MSLPLPELTRGDLRFERWMRHMNRRAQRKRGVKWTVMHAVRRVRVTAIWVPMWAERHRLKDLPGGRCIIWVKQRNVANKIAEQDRDAGGEGEIITFDGRQCPLCKRWMVGELARAQKEHEELCRQAGQPYGRCGVNCS